MSCLNSKSALCSVLFLRIFYIPIFFQVWIMPWPFCILGRSCHSKTQRFSLNDVGRTKLIRHSVILAEYIGFIWNVHNSHNILLYCQDYIKSYIPLALKLKVSSDRPKVFKTKVCVTFYLCSILVLSRFSIKVIKHSCTRDKRPDRIKCDYITNI